MKVSFKNISFFSFHTVCIQHFCISFMCTAQQLDIHIDSKVFSPIIQMPTWQHT